MQNKLSDFLSPIHQLGINKGDVLFVSSDITRLLRDFYKQNREFPSLDDIIDYLQSIVEESGTLIFPTYNWDFCHGEMWEYHKTKCETGVLGAVALKRKDFVRTQHPIYSYAVWGKDQELLCNMTNTSSFGADSVFAYMAEKHAKNLIIDVCFTHCLTFVHYVEQNSGVVTYRYEKNFTALYRDSQGSESTRTYSMFVRDLDLDVVCDFDPMEKQLLEMGIAKRLFIDDIPFTLLDMQASVAPILEDIKNNRSRKLCKYIGQ